MAESTTWDGMADNDDAIYGGSFWAKLEAQAAVAREAQKRRDYDVKVREPYVQSGQKWLGKLNEMMTEGFDLTTIPGYMARLKAGNEAIEMSAAANRGLFSGETGKSLAGWTQDYASGEWGKEAERRAGLAFAGSPFTWSPGTVGGAADYPTLRSFQESYKDMFKTSTGGGDHGGGGDDGDGGDDGGDDGGSGGLSTDRPHGPGSWQTEWESPTNPGLTLYGPKGYLQKPTVDGNV